MTMSKPSLEIKTKIQKRLDGICQQEMNRLDKIHKGASTEDREALTWAISRIRSVLLEEDSSDPPPVISNLGKDRRRADVLTNIQLFEEKLRHARNPRQAAVWRVSIAYNRKARMDQGDDEAINHGSKRKSRRDEDDDEDEDE
jgi:hypothetical protein